MASWRYLNLVPTIFGLTIVAACAAENQGEIQVPEPITQEIGRIMPPDLPQRVKDAYARIIAQRIANGISGAESFKFLRQIINTKGVVVVAGGDHPWNFLSMLIDNSGEVPDVSKKWGAYRDEQFKMTGRGVSHHLFAIEQATPILAKYQDWEMLRRFVVHRARSDSKATLKEYLADPQRYDKMNK